MFFKLLHYNSVNSDLLNSISLLINQMSFRPGFPFENICFPTLPKKFVYDAAVIRALLTILFKKSKQGTAFNVLN